MYKHTSAIFYVVSERLLCVGLLLRSFIMFLMVRHDKTVHCPLRFSKGLPNVLKAQPSKNFMLADHCVFANLDLFFPGTSCTSQSREEQCSFVSPRLFCQIAGFRSQDDWKERVGGVTACRTVGLRQHKCADILETPNSNFVRDVEPRHPK